MITVLILASNEEEDLPAAIASVKEVAQEILVVDGGSKDSTKETARRLGAKVVERPFDNFTNQRDFGMSQASEPWILSLDADERLSAQAAKEIPQVIQSQEYAGYEIPFETEFMGRVMRFSGLSGEKHLRLLRKSAARMKPGLQVHERFEVEGKTRLLSGVIRHRPYKNLSEYLAKCELYTDLAAQDFVRKGKRLSWRHSLIPCYEFFRCYFLRLGILDGYPGLIWSALGAYHRYLRYAKARRLLAASR